MKQKNTTVSNVDDFIRARKRDGSKYIRWTKENKKVFRIFYVAVCEGNWFKPGKFYDGMRFMGIKHYFKK